MSKILSSWSGMRKYLEKDMLSDSLQGRVRYWGIFGGIMKIIDVEDRTGLLIDKLYHVWKESVKATHLFLTDDEIEKIAEYVPDALKNTAHLIIATNNNEPIAFMGIEGEKLEMLFILPEERGKGVGKQLLQYGVKNYNINELGVNEQNPQAKGFYEHMGFHAYKRTDMDEQGNPYPILYMKL